MQKVRRKKKVREETELKMATNTSCVFTGTCVLFLVRHEGLTFCNNRFRNNNPGFRGSIFVKSPNSNPLLPAYYFDLYCTCVVCKCTHRALCMAAFGLAFLLPSLPLRVGEGPYGHRACELAHVPGRVRTPRPNRAGQSAAFPWLPCPHVVVAAASPSDVARWVVGGGWHGWG